MVDTDYGLKDYVADLRAIAAEESDDAAIMERVKPLALRLTSSAAWVPAECRTTNPEQGFGMHLLHEEDDHSLAVFIIAWESNKGLPPHNHKTWAVVTGIEGVEHEVNYNRVDDGSRAGHADLQKVHEETLHPGAASCCLPEDIHSVHNTGDVLSVSLHTYGRHLNHTGRSVYDLATKSEKKLVVNVES